MATTFSRGYKIKLIGTGFEAGTWGNSTNENFKRIDQTFGGVKLNLDVQSPGGAPSVWDPTGPALEWCLADTSDAWETASSARNRYVSFTNYTAPMTVKIRGADVSATNVERIYWVTNNLTGDLSTITFDGGSGANVVLQQGASALIYSDASGNVGEILNTLQAAGLDFRNADAEINLRTLRASALTVVDSATTFDYLKFRTSSSEPAITIGSSDVETNLASPIVDVRGQATRVFVKDEEANSFNIYEGDFPTGATGKNYINVNTVTGSEKVTIGQDLDIDGNKIGISTQATDILIKDNDAAALEIYEVDGSGVADVKMLTFDSTTGSEKLVVPIKLEVTGTFDVTGVASFTGATTFTELVTASAGVVISGNKFGTSDPGTIDGQNIGVTTASTGRFKTLETTETAGLHLNIADSYASFGATAGASGHGVRDDSGVLEVRNTNSDAWGQPYHTGMVSGEGSYFEAVISATIPGAGQVELPHSLGSVPRLFMIVLKIQSGETDDGFSELAEIPFGLAIDQGNSTRPSLVGYADSTNIGFHKHGSGTPYVVDNSGSMTQIDAAKWEIVARAWK